MSASSKTNRIDLRVSKEQKELLETAASIKGISLSSSPVKVTELKGGDSQ